jgi:1,4-dihydroxy-6-naphthoate synthase
MQIDKQILSLGFSPCPNDTFIFDALVNGKINTGSLGFEVVLDDVQTLNEWALAGKLHITKLSYGVLPLVLQQYRVLNSGSALGRGVGPLLISKQTDKDFDATRDTVAIPGEHTTAHLLFSLAYPHTVNKVFMRYDQIEQAVLSGQVDAGVIIHENRFTYRAKGLHLVTELGNYWEQQTGHPIPLGGIVIQKEIPLPIQQKVDGLIAQSIAYAFGHYPHLSDYVRAHAQEMEEAVMRQHIDLYVNDFSRQLGPAGQAAVLRLMAIQGATELQEIFVSEIAGYGSKAV